MISTAIKISLFIIFSVAVTFIAENFESTIRSLPVLILLALSLFGLIKSIGQRDYKGALQLVVIIALLLGLPLLGLILWLFK